MELDRSFGWFFIVYTFWLFLTNFFKKMIDQKIIKIASNTKFAGLKNQYTQILNQKFIVW